MSAGKTIRWGIVGCGDVTESKSGPAFQRAAHSDLVAVMRRDGAKAADYAARHGVGRWYDAVGDLVDDARVDAIYIATPTAAHMSNVQRAAETGKPILVEKPMGLNVAACEAMMAACAKSGSPLYVAYYRRALPRYRRFLDVVRSGRLGRVRHAAIRHFQRTEDLPKPSWKIDPATNGGGLFVDMQAHVIDWLDHAFGPVTHVVGQARNVGGLSEAEDTVEATLTFEADISAEFACGYAADHREEQVTISGDGGTASMSFFSPSPIQVRTGDGVEIIDVVDPPTVHLPLVQEVVDHLNGGPEPSSTAANGLRATAVIDAILEGYRNRTGQNAAKIG